MTNLDIMIEFVKRAQAAQKAINELTRVDAVGTTGGKATVATTVPKRNGAGRRRRGKKS